MGQEEVTLLGVVIVSANLLVEVVKMTLKSILPDKSVFTDAQDEYLKSLYDWHNTRDPDTGAFLWYVPRDVAQDLNESSKNLALISERLTQLVAEMKQSHDNDKDSHKTIVRRIERLSDDINRRGE